MSDLITNTYFIGSELVALAWVLHVPFVIITGYYYRDRSHDEEE